MQISINASCGIEEIMEARKEGQKVVFQVSLLNDSPSIAWVGLCNAAYGAGKQY